MESRCNVKFCLLLFLSLQSIVSYTQAVISVTDSLKDISETPVLIDSNVEDTLFVERTNQLTKNIHFYFGTQNLVGSLRNDQRYVVSLVNHGYPTELTLKQGDIEKMITLNYNKVENDKLKNKNLELLTLNKALEDSLNVLSALTVDGSNSPNSNTVYNILLNPFVYIGGLLLLFLIPSPLLWIKNSFVWFYKKIKEIFRINKNSDDETIHGTSQSFDESQMAESDLETENRLATSELSKEMTGSIEELRSFNSNDVHGLLKILNDINEPAAELLQDIVRFKKQESDLYQDFGLDLEKLLKDYSNLRSEKAITPENLLEHYNSLIPNLDLSKVERTENELKDLENRLANLETKSKKLDDLKSIELDLRGDNIAIKGNTLDQYLKNIMSELEEGETDRVASLLEKRRRLLEDSLAIHFIMKDNLEEIDVKSIQDFANKKKDNAFLGKLAKLTEVYQQSLIEDYETKYLNRAYTYFTGMYSSISNLANSNNEKADGLLSKFIIESSIHFHDFLLRRHKNTEMDNLLNKNYDILVKFEGSVKNIEAENYFKKFKIDITKFSPFVIKLASLAKSINPVNLDGVLIEGAFVKIKKK